MLPSIVLKRPIERPVSGFVLALIGGLIVMAGTIYSLLAYGGAFYYGYPASYFAYGVIGGVSGAGVLLGCALAYLLPRQHVAWGILIIVFGIVSMFTLYGSLFFVFVLLGTPLAVIGGAFVIGWKAEREPRFEDYRTCLGCGRHIRADYPVCPFCGTRAAGLAAPPRPPSMFP